MLDAIGSNDHISQFADCYAIITKRSVISRCTHGQTRIKHVNDGKLSKEALYLVGRLLILRALKDFHENDVADNDCISAERSTKQLDVREIGRVS